MNRYLILDLETTGLDWWREKIVGIGIRLEPEGREEFFPYPDPGWLREYLLEYRNRVWIGHNIKFDLLFVNYPPEIVYSLQIRDTMDMVHLYDSRLSKSLVEVEKEFLGSETKFWHLHQENKRKIKSWDLDKVKEYCLNDVLITWNVFRKLEPELEKLEVFHIFRKNMELLKVLYEIEYFGFLFDKEEADRSIKILEENLKLQEEQFFQKVGVRFNWRSHKQLSYYAYDYLGFPRPENPFLDPVTGEDLGRNPESRKYNSTMVSSSILVGKAKHPWALDIQFLRETDKAIDFIQRLSSLTDDKNFLHSSFNISGTRTGRISSSRPNLQNIMSGMRGFFLSSSFLDAEAVEAILNRSQAYNVRRLFIARPGYKIVSIDYKQMEMRMFGIVSKDPHMLEFLQAGTDIHSQIAQRVWGKADEITRDWAKQIGFGLIYGMTMGSLRFRLNLTLEEAKKITSDYWNTFPTIRPWLFGVVEECKKKGYLRYWSGRIWREDRVEKMYRGANALIQGGCADLLSVAVLRVNNYIKRNNLDIRMVNLVHDEIVFEMREEDFEHIPKIANIMQVEDLFGIPFIVDVKIGRSHGELESYGKSDTGTGKQIFSQ
jgi:DNA polymerase-1